MGTIKIDNVNVDELMNLLHKIREKTDTVDITVSEEEHSVVITPAMNIGSTDDLHLSDDDIDKLI